MRVGNWRVAELPRDVVRQRDAHPATHARDCTAPPGTPPTAAPAPPTCKGRLDGVDVLRRGAPRDLQDAVQLVHGGGARKDGLAVDQLTQDAACASTNNSRGMCGWVEAWMIDGRCMVAEAVQGPCSS